MTDVQTLHAMHPPRPVFRGPLDGQRPRVVGHFGADPWLLVTVAVLVGFGILMVFNVSYFYGQTHFADPLLFFRKHVVSVVLGLALAVVTSRLSSETYRRLAYPLLGLGFLGLLLVLVPGIGTVHNGARRWIPIGPLSLQPTELTKFALVVYLAHSLAKRGERMREFLMGVLPHCVVVGAIALLCLPEPDFGTAALSLGLLVCMLFVGGARVWHLASFALAALPLAVGAVIVAPYRVSRVWSFLNPEADRLGKGHQLFQSLIAFGSGGVWGVGLGESEQKLGYLPAAHTDFIFSVIGEELGLVGALVVLALFVVVGARGFRIAFRHPDPFASLLAAGTTLLLLLQVVLNVAVVLGCLPTKGLTLPFISYGGSAMMMVLAETGVLLALAREAG